MLFWAALMWGFVLGWLCWRGGYRAGRSAGVRGLTAIGQMRWNDGYRAGRESVRDPVTGRLRKMV